jgi:uncharacterized protein YcbX
MARLARIVIYPFKSFDGLEVAEARVLPSGALEHDRQFALFDAGGKWINGKRTPRIHLLRSQIDVASRQIRIAVNGTTHDFHIDADRAALEQWLAEFFGMTVRIAENAAAGFPDDSVAPAPTIISTATLAEVAGWFASLALEDVRRRFRANLEIDGLEAFWEDRLYAEEGDAVRFQVGEVQLEGTNPCQRCVVPTRSPVTGERYEDFVAIFEKQRYETFPYWATRSRFDHFYRLAVNTRPVAGKSGMIRVGDEITLVG